MKKFLLVICLAMASVMVVTPSFATEMWDPHLRGVGEGLAAGALPPPGFYFINDFYFAYYHGYGPYFGAENNGQRNAGVKVFAYVDVPVLLWTPGCKLLGADYGVALAQPFDYTHLKISSPAGAVSGTQLGTFNTILVPYILSWKLPCDFHIKTAFEVATDDAWSSPGDRVASITKHNNFAGSDATGLSDRLNKNNGRVYAESGNGFWSFTPTVGISWLHAGWNLSAEFFYSFNTKNTATNYQSGDEFAADYTLTYTYQKWTVGFGASQENQVQRDKFDVNDGTGYRSQPGTRAEAYTIGPILGYNFGPFSVQFAYNFPIYTNNEVGGEWFNFRLVVPLGKPF